MKNIKSFFFFSAVLFFFTSCEKAFMEANPDTDDLSIFDEYTKLVREKYAMLDYKGVDIDMLSDSLRATINGDISDDELFMKLAVITNRLRDGHSDLSQNPNDTSALFASYDFLSAFPPALDFEILFNNYISKDINPGAKTLEGGLIGFRAIWGTLPQDNEIGYIWIPTWNDEISDEEIETIFTDLKNTKGLVFDMRFNTGGDPSLATKFASYLTDQAVYTGYERFKTGPGKNDFTDSHVTLQPTSSTNKYLKKVAVLTDRFCYSASTTFLYSVDPIPTVFTVGQISGGGSGSVADGYLANGWKWGLSTSEFIDAKDRHLDDGVEADIPVELDLEDTTKDELIERAIIELQ